jgi:hypothetical protein
VQVELGPLGLFRGRERLFFRFRVVFLLYIRAPEELNLLVREEEGGIRHFNHDSWNAMCPRICENLQRMYACLSLRSEGDTCRFTH